QDLSDLEFSGIVLDSDRVASAADHRLDMLSASYLAAHSWSPGLNNLLNQTEKYAPVFQYGDLRIFENRGAQERVTLVSTSGVEMISTQRRQLESTRQPDFDPTRQVILGALPTSFPSGRDVSGPGEIGRTVIVSPDEVRTTVRVMEPSILVFNELDYP